jgi:hypothetical protein
MVGVSRHLLSPHAGRDRNRDPNHSGAADMAQLARNPRTLKKTALHDPIVKEVPSTTVEEEHPHVSLAESICSDTTVTTYVFTLISDTCIAWPVHIIITSS